MRVFFCHCQKNSGGNALLTTFIIALSGCIFDFHLQQFIDLLPG